MRSTIRVGVVLAACLVATLSGAIAFDLNDVIKLKVSGIEEETILRVVDAEGVVFRLSTQDILDLKDIGASEEFIRALMDTEQLLYDTAPGARYYEDYVPSGTRDYYTVFRYHYYDPYAYSWYAWPSSYFYVSPFWWAGCGFYWGGHWSSDWCYSYGPCWNYCNYNYGYGYYCGSSRTRVRADRPGSQNLGAATERLQRERSMWAREGRVTPSNVTRVDQRSVDRSASASRYARHEQTGRSTYRSSDGQARGAYGSSYRSRSDYAQRSSRGGGRAVSDYRSSYANRSGTRGSSGGQGRGVVYRSPSTTGSRSGTRSSSRGSISRSSYRSSASRSSSGSRAGTRSSAPRMSAPRSSGHSGGASRSGGGGGGSRMGGSAGGSASRSR